ncbi:MAG: phosphotransferase family protein [Pseudomonadales bacterium]|jgi:aminoglycoside phosphotransferase (APT) family kinase protein
MVATVPVKTQHRFDEARLDAFLCERVHGYEGPLTVSQFEGGQSNPTFLLATPGRNYVLRRKPPGELARSAHAVDREFRVISALAGTEVPVPEALVLCEDEAVIGTVFFVMSHVPGRILADPLLPDLSPADRTALIYDYVDTLATLHALDPEALGLGDYGRPGNYFARQISRWGRQYQETETEPVPEMHRLLAWLEASVPEQTATRIVHGDFQLGNSLVHETEPKVAAVLDWELSTVGDPLADFTYFTGPWHAGPGERSYADQDLDALGIPGYEDLVARYCSRSGHPGIEHESFYRAFHAFRSAAILQGIIRRALQGNNAGELALTFTPDHVRALAQRGLSYVD